MLITILGPVFGIIVGGYLLARAGLVPPHASAGINGLVYYAAFPALLFLVVARTPPREIFHWPFLGTWLGGFVAVYGFTAVVSFIWHRDGSARLGMRALDTTCASTAFIGVPLCISAFGPDAALPAILATVLLAIVDLSASILLIEIERNEAGHAAHIARGIWRALARNPLMIASVAGVGWALSGLTLPVSAVRLLEIVGGAAIPCSLVTLGMFFAGRGWSGGTTEVAWLTVCKLVLHPLVTWMLAVHVFVLDPRWTAIVVVLAALPPATTVFVIAQRYELHMLETASTMLVSTVASVATISLVLYLLGVNH